MHSEGAGRDVRALEELQGLLQRVDLGLAGARALLEGLALVDALRHELLVVAVCSQQLILCGLRVRGVSLQLGLRRDLVGLIHLSLLQLHRFVLVGLDHEALISLGGGSLRGLGVGLEVGEIGLDDLQESEDAEVGLVLLAVLFLAESLHAVLVARVHIQLGARLNAALEVGVGEGVPLIGAHLHARLEAEGAGIALGLAAQLDEAGRCGSLLVEVLEHSGGSCDGRLSGLGVIDGLFVLGLLRVAHGCGLPHKLVQLLHLLGESGDLFRELQDGGLALIDGGTQGIDILAELSAGDLVFAHLGVAEAFVISILVGLFQKASYHGVDHLLHLDEGIRGHLLCKQCQALAVQALALLLQELANAAVHTLGPEVGATTDLHKRPR
mmetsp:Transcript_7538/g.21083  ORF Transcript_7538/g.21083 Transcript_7538/m.21083 type:complete len:383 (+) Transcript_7538:80-1228(+)